MASHGRLRCGSCGAGLVAGWSGLRCPRLAACGRGGQIEAAAVAVRLDARRAPRA